MAVRWPGLRALTLVVACVSAATGQQPPGPPPAQPAPPSSSAPAPVAPAPPVSEPGVPAPREVVAELRVSLIEVIRRFEGMDTEGVLSHVSDRYRTGPLTKRALREQLRGIFAAHDIVRARVRIDDVRVIGDRYWVYSTGDVTGRLRFLGTPTALFAWEREPEVVWREGDHWRLIGDQQP